MQPKKFLVLCIAISNLENILVGADRLPNTNINRLRVTDFGLVKTITDNGVQTAMSGAEEVKSTQVQFTRGAGTPLYMAPEQWKGEPVGAFTDIYAFGCILYEMLSGQGAVEGQTITDLQTSHCEGIFRPISINLSQEILTFVLKCLKLDSDRA